VKVLIFACVGVAIEVIFTAVSGFIKTRNLKLTGYTYLWMFPIWGIAAPLYALVYPQIVHWNFAFRCLVYALILYVLEYGSGWLLRLALGECPWEKNYLESRWNVHGLIRLDYFPAWFVAVFFFERLYLALQSIP